MRRYPGRIRARAPRSRSDLRVLVYHRIEDPAAPQPSLAPDLVSATPAAFAWQMRHLARFYHPVGAAELRSALEGRHTLPPRAVLVTFDDGYRDFMQIAWPILRQYQVPAILFVCSAVPDAPDHLFWWDALWQWLARTAQPTVRLSDRVVLPLRRRRERVVASRAIAESVKRVSPAARAASLERLAAQLGVRAEPAGAMLSWRELRHLAANGVTIAAHGRTHELLDQLPRAALSREVVGCRDDIARAMGECPPLFAYPNGTFSPVAIDVLRAAGFLAGFTTTHGLNRLPFAHSLLLRRDAGRVPLWRFMLHLVLPVARARAFRHPLRSVDRDDMYTDVTDR